jgi:hypothetical protein
MKLFKDFWRIGVYGNAFLAVMMAVGWLMGPDYLCGCICGVQQVLWLDG